MSTNKVYGDRPNTIPLRELEIRWDYADPEFANGIPESFSIDQSKHSIFGASKVASTSWCRNTAATSECRPVACAAAV